MITATSVVLPVSSDLLLWSKGIYAAPFLFFVEISSAHAAQGEHVLQEIETSIKSTKSFHEEVLVKKLRHLHHEYHPRACVIGFLDYDTVHFISIGDAVVYLKRKNKIGRILYGESTVKGQIQPEDQLLMCSHEVVEHLSRDIFSDAFTRAKEAQPHPSDETTQMTPAAIFSVTSLMQRNTKKSLLPKVQLKNPLSFVRSFHFNIKKHPGILRLRSMSRRKKFLLCIVIILVGVFLTNILSNFYYTQTNIKYKKLQETLQTVSREYDEAVTLRDLNPQRARSLLASSKVHLAPLVKEFPKESKEQQQISEWVGKITEEEVRAFKIYKLTALPLFYDITLVKPNGIGSTMASYEKTKAVLDTKNKTIYILATDTKQSFILAGAEVVKNARTIAVHGNFVYLYNNDGVVKIDKNTKKSQIVIPYDPEWGDVQAIASYGGNIYLLDPGKHTIWKYIATEDGFTPRQTYINSGSDIQLTGSKKLVIDGSVWVLHPLGVLKFTGGVPDSFVLKGIADSLRGLEMISTSEVDKRIYMLDTNLSRVLVLEKDGTYVAQYQAQELKDATDIIVSEEEKKIFVLSGSKIYAIDIQ